MNQGSATQNRRNNRSSGPLASSPVDFLQSNTDFGKVVEDSYIQPPVPMPRLKSRPSPNEPSRYDLDADLVRKACKITPRESFKIDKALKALNAQVEIKPEPRGSSFVENPDGSLLIIIDPLLGLSKKNFTITREICRRTYIEVRKIARESAWTPEATEEVNKIAKALLMPRQEVESKLELATEGSSYYKMVRAAAKLNVPVSVLESRISELSIPLR